MNDEQISALVDDALSADASSSAVDELLDDPRARATWGRYHLIGDALRASARQDAVQAARPGNVVAFPQPPAPKAAPPVAEPRRGVPIGLAWAAAAAVVAFAFAISALVPHRLAAVSAPAVADTGRAPVLVAPPANVAAAGPEVVVIDGDGNEVQQVSQNTIVQSDEAQQRMNDYLANFNERRARQPMPGVHPYVRIVGYEAR